MESEEPFTEADVRVARHAFRVAKKCRTAVDKVVARHRASVQEAVPHAARFNVPTSMP